MVELYLYILGVLLHLFLFLSPSFSFLLIASKHDCCILTSGIARHILLTSTRLEKGILHVPDLTCSSKTKCNRS